MITYSSYNNFKMNILFYNSQEIIIDNVNKIIFKHLTHLKLRPYTKDIHERTQIIIIDRPPFNTPYKRVYKDDNYRLYYSKLSNRLKVLVVNNTSTFNLYLDNLRL